MEDIKKYSVPLYHTIGNHDTDGAALEEVLKAYNMPKEYYYFDVTL